MPAGKARQRNERGGSYHCAVGTGEEERQQGGEIVFHPGKMRVGALGGVDEWLDGIEAHWLRLKSFRMWPILAKYGEEVDDAWQD